MADERKDQPAAENVDKADDAVGTLPAERKGRFDGDAEDEQAPSALPWAEKWLSAERLTPLPEGLRRRRRKGARALRMELLAGPAAHARHLKLRSGTAQRM